MTMVVTVEETVSAEDEAGIVMVEAHMAAVIAMEGDSVVAEMVVVEGHTVAVTEMAVAHLAVMMDRVLRTAVVGTTEGHMAEVVVVVAMVTVVVEEIRIAVVVMAEAEGVVVEVDRLVAVKMKCSLSQTRYLFRVFPIKSLNKSSLSILVPLA